MRGAVVALAVLLTAVLPGPAAAEPAPPVDPVAAFVESFLPTPVDYDASTTSKALSAVRDLAGSRPATFQTGAPAGRVADAPFAVAILEVLYMVDYYWGEESIEILSMCSGSLITDSVVLTAGHCVQEDVWLISDPCCDYLHTYVVIQGAPDVLAMSLPATAQVALASSAAPLPGYSGDVPILDVGFILLDEPIGLPETSFPFMEGMEVPFIPNDEELARTAPLTLASYGSANAARPAMDGKLQMGKYDVVPDAVCVDAFASQFPVPTDNLLCTRSRGTTLGSCHGDSGAGFFQERFGRKVIVAVVSAGDPDCRPGYPNLEARLGPAIAAANGHTLSEGALGSFDEAATLADGEPPELIAQLVGTKVVIPLALNVVVSPKATIWAEGAGARSVPVAIHPSGIAVDLKSVVPGQPFLIEVFAYNPLGHLRVMTAAALLEAREPGVDVAFTRDVAGAPVLLGTLLDGDGVPLAKHAFTVDTRVGTLTKKFMVTSKPDGSFVVPMAGLPAGPRTFNFTGKPVAAALIAGFAESHELDLVARTPILETEQRLDALGYPILVGRLVDQDDLPIAKAKVTGKTVVGGVTKSFSATTIANGSFVLKLTGLPAGEHDLVLRTPTDARLLVAPLNDTVGLDLVERAPSIEVTVQEEAGMTIVRGVVHDQTDAPLAKLAMQGALQPSGKRVRATSAADGSFMFNLGPLPDGDYQLTVTSAANARTLLAPMTTPVAFTV